MQVFSPRNMRVQSHATYPIPPPCPRYAQINALKGGVCGGGRGLGLKFVYQQWPDQTCFVLNCVFSRDGHFVVVGAGGGTTLNNTKIKHRPGYAHPPCVVDKP